MIITKYEFGDLTSDLGIDTVSSLALTSLVLAILEIFSNGGDGFCGLVDLFVIVLG
jgi:hypothetical protein